MVPVTWRSGPPLAPLPDPWIGRCDRCRELSIQPGAPAPGQLLANVVCGGFEDYQWQCKGTLIPVPERMQEVGLASFLLGGFAAMVAAFAEEDRTHG